MKFILFIIMLFVAVYIGGLRPRKTHSPAMTRGRK